MDCRSTTLWVLFIVAAQSAIASPAAKDLFDEPAFALHTKALLSRFFGSDVQRPAELLFDLRFKLRSCKAFVSPDQGEFAAPPASFDLFKQQQRYSNATATLQQRYSNATARSPMLAGITTLSSQLPPASHSVMRLRPHSFLAPSYPRIPLFPSSSRFVNRQWLLSGVPYALAHSAYPRAGYPTRHPRHYFAASAKNRNTPSSSADNSVAKSATDSPCDERRRSR